MPFTIQPYCRFAEHFAQWISHDWLRGYMQPGCAILIFVFAGCSGSPPSLQQPACISEQTWTSCFYLREAQKNEKLIIFVHGVFSSSADAWGEVENGKTWPELVKNDDRFKGFDIYLVNYRTTKLTPSPNIYQVAKRELQRLKDNGVFNRYKEIYFITHSMGGLVTKTLLKQLNQKENEALLRQVKAVIFLGTPSQGATEAILGKWISFNLQLAAMVPAHLNQWLSELEDDWIRLMEGRPKSRYPRAFCAFEMRPYVLNYIVVPREAAYSRCDIFEGLDLNHSDLAVPKGRESDPYDWAMARINETSKEIKSNVAIAKEESIDLNDTDTKLQVLFECDTKPFIKAVPSEGGPKVVLFFPSSPSIHVSGRHISDIQDLGIPGQANTFSDPETNGGHGHVCQITNYEKYPVLNIELDFELRFKEPLYKPGHSVEGGAIKSAIPWTSIIEKIEPNEKVVFYLINYSQYFLEADTPDWIYFRRLGEFQTRTVRLSSVRGRGTLFFGPLKHPVLPKMYK